MHTYLSLLHPQRRQPALLFRGTWHPKTTLCGTQAARERFNEFLHMASMPADDADVERLRRESREAAAKDGLKGGDADLPDKFYKLPRIRFLLLLCKELLRINRFIITFGEDRFTAVDVQRSGKINIVAVRSFVKSMSPSATDSQVGCMTAWVLLRDSICHYSSTNV